jgi:alkylation response protein AidB-like acyl-CoA dehydrogenase
MTIDTRLESRPLQTGVEEVAMAAERHAGAADATRRLAPEVVEGLRAAGFARYFVGSAWGGTEGTFAGLTRSVMSLGEACPSTAWIASLAAYSARFAAHLPLEGHHELWGESPDVFVVTGLVPNGQAVPVAGGWRLTGRWSYVSGVEFAGWALLCAPVAGDDGAGDSSAGDGPPELRFFAIARDRFEILETWDSVGVRATGSHTVTVTDQFIPSHLSYPRTEMISGQNSVSTALCHNVPFQAVGALTFIAPIVGAANGALRAAAALLADKRRTLCMDVEIVRSSGRVDVSRHLVEQNAHVIDTAEFTPAAMARNQRNGSFAAEQSTEAVNGLMRAAGTGGLSEASALQRFWRDVVGMASHVALRYESAPAKTYLPVIFGQI